VDGSSVYICDANIKEAVALVFPEAVYLAISTLSVDAIIIIIAHVGAIVSLAGARVGS